ncbi:MAG: hypothetical protein AAF329_02535 [Cyanobacteria bacterium P01_A01_bin.17]
MSELLACVYNMHQQKSLIRNFLLGFLVFCILSTLVLKVFLIFAA